MQDILLETLWSTVPVVCLYVYAVLMMGLVLQVMASREPVTVWLVLLRTCWQLFINLA